LGLPVAHGIKWRSARRLPVRGPVGVHEGGGHVVLQLDDGEPQRGDGQHLGAVDGAVPLEVPRGRHAELVGQVAPLVVILGGQTSVSLASGRKG